MHYKQKYRCYTEKDSLLYLYKIPCTKKTKKGCFCEPCDRKQKGQTMTFFINYYHIDKSKEIKISFRQGRQYNYNKGGCKKTF